MWKCGKDNFDFNLGVNAKQNDFNALNYTITVIHVQQSLKNYCISHLRKTHD